MFQKRLRLHIDIDESVALTDKHAGTNTRNGNEWWTNGDEESVDWVDNDDPNELVSTCLDVSHSRATDVARSVSSKLLTGRSHLNGCSWYECPEC